jgi:gentisate 1,2-dioxygenase
MEDEQEQKRGGGAAPGEAGIAGPKHNQDNEAVWARWSKKRTFVRALEGTYSHLTKELLDQPRVYSARSTPWKGGPVVYGKHIISPGATKITQSIETHIEAYGPGGYGQKHGHLNSAVFFVLKGRGHDVHDGRRIEWKAGEVMLVENGCVHQHFNDDPDREAILLVFKAKPLFLFMHLLYQKMISYPPTELAANHQDWAPPTDL